SDVCSSDLKRCSPSPVFVYAQSATTRSSLLSASSSSWMRESTKTAAGSSVTPLSVTSSTFGAMRSTNVDRPASASKRSTVVERKTSGPGVRSRSISYELTVMCSARSWASARVRFSAGKASSRSWVAVENLPTPRWDRWLDFSGVRKVAEPAAQHEHREHREHDRAEPQHGLAARHRSRGTEDGDDRAVRDRLRHERGVEHRREQREVEPYGPDHGAASARGSHVLGCVERDLRGEPCEHEPEQRGTDPREDRAVDAVLHELAHGAPSDGGSEGDQDEEGEQSRARRPPQSRDDFGARQALGFVALGAHRSPPVGAWPKSIARAARTDLPWWSRPE